MALVVAAKGPCGRSATQGEVMTDYDASQRIERLVRAGANRLKLGDFRRFILRGSVVDLATGIVIGAAFTALVTALVNDFLSPLIGIPMSGSGEFGKRFWTIGGSRFHYGDFVNKLVSLLLVGIAPLLLRGDAGERSDGAVSSRRPSRASRRRSVRSARARFPGTPPAARSARCRSPRWRRRSSRRGRPA